MELTEPQAWDLLVSQQCQSAQIVKVGLKDAESPHPKATALDGTDIECTACGWKQMVFTLEIE